MDVEVSCYLNQCVLGVALLEVTNASALEVAVLNAMYLNQEVRT